MDGMPLGTVAARRILRNSTGWFSEGTALKAEARLRRKCVECRRELPSRRTPYFGRRCAWRFRGRYFWDAARIYVMHRDRYTCQSCKVRWRAHELAVDHTLELAIGGPSLSYENLQTICKPCHRAKTLAFLRRGAWGRIQPLARPTETPSAFPCLEGLIEWFPA